MTEARDDKYCGSAEYQLAERVLKAWEASPVDDNGFGETVALARAYMAMVEATRSHARRIGDWVRCSPGLLDDFPNACRTLPRRDGDGTYSHDHFVADGTGYLRSAHADETPPSTTRLIGDPNTPTPRTDEEVEIAKTFPATNHGLWVSAEFARQLEREAQELYEKVGELERAQAFAASAIAWKPIDYDETDWSSEPHEGFHHWGDDHLIVMRGGKLWRLDIPAEPKNRADGSAQTP